MLTPQIYESQICKARTFGFLKDVENLRKKGQKIAKKDTYNMHVINAMSSKFKFSTKKVVFYGNGEVKRECKGYHS